MVRFSQHLYHNLESQVSIGWILSRNYKMIVGVQGRVHERICVYIYLSLQATEIQAA